MSLIGKLTFIQGYDADDTAYPILGILCDPRSPGYAVPENLSPHPNVDVWPNHVFDSAVPTPDGKGSLWTYLIFPGAITVDDLTDDPRGAVHVTTRLVSDLTSPGLLTISGSTLTKTEYQGVDAGKRKQIIQTWQVTRRYGYQVEPDTGIGMITESHVVANGTRGGVDYPVSRAVSAVSVANPTILTLNSTAGMATGFDVVLAGFTTTPTINGTKTATVIDATHISVPVNVTAVSDGIGTAILAAQIHREVERVNDTFAIQGSSQVDLASLSTATKTIPTRVNFPWPNKLLGITEFIDFGSSASAPVGSIPLPASIHYGDGFQYSADVAMRFAAGPEGKAQASITRSYSIGPPTNSESPLQMYLSSGEIVCIGGSINNSLTYVVDALGNAYYVVGTGNTIRRNVATIPHCFSGTVTTSGSVTATLGIPTIAVRITPSVPTTFSYGQSFVWDVQVTPGRNDLYVKDVLTVTTPASGGPTDYFTV